MNIKYFDNAATSWPKPETTISAMNAYIHSVGGSPGRSGHRLSIEAGRIILDAREAIAKLFGINNILRIIFTKNATESLNIAIQGLLKPGDHVITSGMEHNSVMRPLRAMGEKGVTLTIIPCSKTGEIDPYDVSRAIRPTTRAIYLCHASNVTGTIMPIAEIGAIAREKEIIFCVDAAQTAGTIPIDVLSMNVDLLAFTGHKSLYGPQGTGGLYIAEGIEKILQPIMQGGTGSSSESEEHPDFLPDKFESGTINTIGIAGLGAGVRFVLNTGIETIRSMEAALTSMLIDGLSVIRGVTLHGCNNASKQTPVVSLTIKDLSPSDIALTLDEDFNIMIRSGLQCAPAAHKTIGTFPAGTVRFSMGYFTTSNDVQQALKAIDHIAA